VIEQRYFSNQVRALTELLEKERERNKGLVGRIAFLEANAARLGFDSEETHKAILKPGRSVNGDKEALPTCWGRCEGNAQGPP